MRVSRCRRANIRVIDVLAITFVFGVLAALVLPGMQRTGGGRRSECLNNLRNIGVAMHNFESQKGRLPPSGVWDVVDPATFAEWSNLAGIAENPSHQATMRYSWALELMPYLDHSDIYDEWDFSADTKRRAGYGSYWQQRREDSVKTPPGGNQQLANTNLRMLTCPADPTTIPGKGNPSYVVNGGFAYHWKLDYLSSGGDGKGVVNGQTTNVSLDRWKENVRNSGVFFLEPSKTYTEAFVPKALDGFRPTKLSDVGDGLATTVMVSENITAGTGAVWETPTIQSSWACPHPWNTSFFVNGGVTAINMTPLNIEAGYDFSAANNRGPRAPPVFPFGKEGGVNGDLTGANEDRFPYPNSGHPKVVNILMCDGSARSISEDIDGAVWARLVTPNGGKFVRPSDGLLGGEVLEDRRGRGFTQRKDPIE